MEAPPPFTGYLIFAAPVLRALLATWGRDDLAAALLACVVGGSLLSLFCCCRLRMSFDFWQSDLK
ncbi:hypothetical protein F5887DRAFT_966513 [Amanita rubescens]|nr:hypothetical protein F5887DRAFT_966513 [Amanita rubescens]